MRRSIYLFLVLFVAPALAAQPAPHDSLVAVTLPVVEIQATRATESEASAARSVYVRSREDVALDPSLSLQRALRGIPGIQINDRGHFALGERLLIRGMGFRSAFGVRGAQVFLDGIPLTIADGQSMLDIVEPAAVARAEVLRGPSSLYWGNSSGGVLFLTSIQDTTAVRLRGMLGGHGLRHFMGKFRVPLETGRLHAFVSSVHRSGWREHSNGGFLRVGSRGQFDLGTSTVLTVMGAAAFQDVNAPGSLTEEQVATNPRMADSRYVAAGAGKESKHYQAGGTLSSATPLGQLTVAAYGISRGLSNPLTFASIDLDRAAAGTYAQLHNSHRPLAWTLGWDARIQHDDRRNSTDNGVELDQNERVRSLSASAMLNLALGQHLRVTAGARMDAIHFAMTDRLLSNGDQSGSRSMAAVSPAAGVAFSTGHLLAYGNVSTAFETPTTTELVNRPEVPGDFNPDTPGEISFVMPGGFNPDIGPQRTRGLEAGIRGHFPRLDLRADIAFFWMRIYDRLLPHQGRTGRTWYENGGTNDHRGLEVALEWPVNSPVRLHATVSAGRYVFLGVLPTKLHIPGVPGHQGYVGVHLAHHGFIAEIAAEFASNAWVNFGNTLQSKGHLALDLYVAHQGVTVRGASAQPFVRLTNILNTKYATSIVVNAFGGRYFEPAPGRTAQAGLSVSL